MQQIIVLLIFAGALGYLGTRLWKTLRRPATGGCAKGCGCSTPEKPTLQAR
ncbi:FeoB-associated Cys-rich membrane protein [Cytophagaceae bacterium SJW1-29]|uniref:FeoB-associated Cys-rich membrane protein n=1 Tax=Salmonirosea aquatica TaxID=2654236 RepID=A0A7C9FNF4_9BACT|nr:FeoB-associated Cys-rich membrane protein [Cytophagaceae bacterium SJW1-29]